MYYYWILSVYPLIFLWLNFNFFIGFSPFSFYIICFLSKIFYSFFFKFNFFGFSYFPFLSFPWFSNFFLDFSFFFFPYKFSFFPFNFSFLFPFLFLSNPFLAFSLLLDSFCFISNKLLIYYRSLQVTFFVKRKRINIDYIMYILLAEGPGVAREKKILKKNLNFFCLRHSPATRVHKKL